jgi:hypothetical protein
MTTGFNWSWIVSDTKNDSGCLYELRYGTYYLNQAYRGAISSDDLNNFSTATNSSISSIASNYNTVVLPLLQALPHGEIDTRWSYTASKGLRAEIDAFKYGIQGSTLFVFSDAASTVADGRYWHILESRPKTIAEAIEDLWVELSGVSVLESSGTTDLTDVWNAIGWEYYNGTGGDTLYAKHQSQETKLSHLATDLYDSLTGGLGSAQLDYSFAEHLDKLLKLHGVSGGWQTADPDDMDHDDIEAGSHTHDYTEVAPAGGFVITDQWATAFTQATTLEEEIKQLRQAVKLARGGTYWYTATTGPGSLGVESLSSHINHVGSGTAATSNPHALTYADIGADALLNNIAGFIGMVDYTTSETPTYSSTTYVANGDSLQTAVGKLDAAVHSAIGTTVVRFDFGPYDRTALSEEELTATPITIEHNLGRKPIVEVHDAIPDEYDDDTGMYSSPVS